IARVVKARDVSGDGVVDIIVGTTYQTQSRLFLGDGDGGFDEVTDTHLPQTPASVGDLEVGDVDGDGDMDLVLADWGAGDPFESEGAPVRLWLNQGDGHFVAAPAGNVPARKIRWSWDLELVDVDNDRDLDVAVSCKVCDGGALYHNRGDGTFEDASDGLPQFTNNYELEPLDLDGDGFLDLVTINDGEQASDDEFDRREHVFMNDGTGRFAVGGQDVWPDAENAGADDNAVVVLDVDSDGDPDFVIASLSGDDRLMVNDGGTLREDATVFGGDPTPGTLGIAVADLDGDHKLDVVQSQGEVAEDERVYHGTGIAVDSAAPRVDLVEQPDLGGGAAVTVRARVHDAKTPVAAFDFEEVVLCEGACADATGAARHAMTWYGGALWRAELPAQDGLTYQVCATDAAGNQACGETLTLGEAGGGDEDKTDAGDHGGGGGGCSCAAGRRAPLTAGLLILGAVLTAAVRRRRRRGARPADRA
ncbi:MAG TPA: VCBS repeat-containing protein, partial [Kofleriaceae bacterium]|nr:VCBS repeat-containing protein [Kofleriaceae bacterium]